MELTNREIEVLTRIGRGHSNKIIARDLFISLPTVRKHRQNIYKKLNLSSAAQAAAYAIDRKYLKRNHFSHLNSGEIAFTDREAQFMRLSAEGLTDRQIASFKDCLFHCAQASGKYLPEVRV